MKQSGLAIRALCLGSLALGLLAGCSGGGGGSGGRMYVVTCSLGCNSGSGGQDVTCGIVNTYVNQDIAIQFSEPVDLAWVLANTTAFRVIDDATAAAPPGKYLLDPADNRRLIWRPLLDFSPAGVPTFGFEDDAVYRIDVPGTFSGSAGPFVQSVDGKSNESRVFCTINTSEGITDPIPGKPRVQVFVDEIDPITQQITTVEIGQLVGQVATSSLITLVFDDIMNIGTVVTPSSGTAPFITVNIDPDGNISDPSDQVAVGGSWTFAVDDEALTTTAVFTPTGGLPSGGNGERKVVVNIPAQVVDLVDNPVANGGLKSFTPQVLTFTAITIPTGGEQFADQAALDSARSSADWGETSPGFLIPGQGGGSGRLGDLVVPAGQTVTLNTSPMHATASIQFTAIPGNNNTLVLGDPVTPTVFAFKNTPVDPNYDILRRNTFTAHQIAEVATHLNNFVAPDPVGSPQDLVIEQATYTVDGDLLVITWDVVGAAGNGAFFISSSSTAPIVIGATLTAGGLDSVSFGGPNEPGERALVTNFDFQANPAGTPPPFAVADGVFEFARLTVEAQGTLVLAGTNPARLYVRGLFDLRSQALIAAAGESQPAHLSNAPLGQLGGTPGPGGGDGGGGADRPDNTNTDLLNISPVQNAGIENPGFGQSFGRQALGVGGFAGTGAGLGGARWPNLQPTQTFLPMEMEANDVGGLCVSKQVAGPGSGGAYATDGGDGVPMAVFATALPATLGGTGASNTPGITAGGPASQVGLPAPGVVPIGARSLDPDSGFLRGGAGGGGGGASTEDSQTKLDPAGNPTPVVKPDCFVNPPVANPPTPTPVTVYRSHSAGAGGGGGGAVQVQAGREADLSGTIDASGGDGGSASSAAAVQSARAAPGGGGSGGGILIQARFVDVAPVPNRLLIDGGLGGTLFDTTLGANLSVGGDGGIGLVRAESVIQNPAFFDEVAAAISPFDGGVVNQQDPNNPNAAINWLSTDTWIAETTLPGAFSAGQSCWYKPAGNFLSLDFADDSQGFGWDMDLILDTGGGPQVVPYRASSFFGGNSPQEHWGELYAENGGPGAPIVVRFQGAKSIGTITDPCNIDPFAPGSPIDPNSITQWVWHPDELDAFQPAPDMVRFLVLFDASHPDFAFIQGVTNLRIQATPN